MSTIQFGGVISGLNTQGIIDALVAVKKQPLTDLQSKEASLTAQKAAYAQVGTALDDLVAKVQAFTVTSAGASRTATPPTPRSSPLRPPRARRPRHIRSRSIGLRRPPAPPPLPLWALRSPGP